MALLLVSDLQKMFTNYEPSKLKIWEIIRTYHPYHISALLFLLENLRSSLDESIAQTDCINLDDHSYVFKKCIINTKPTLNLDACTVMHSMLPENTKNYLQTHNDGQLTILGLLELISQYAKTDHLDKNEYIALFNMSTKNYKTFLYNFNSFLCPEEYQPNRNEMNESSTINVVDKFLQYYRNISLDPQCMQATNIKALTFVPRKRTKIIFTSQIDDAQDFIVQPSYRGLRVIVNSFPISTKLETKTTTRVYNIYGELVYNLMYNINLNVTAIFEALLIPIDNKSRCRSWHFWNYKQDFKIIAVDLFKIKNISYMHLPFNQRYQALVELFKNHKTVSTTAITETVSNIIHQYESSDILSPISGVVFRHKTSKITDDIYEYKFNMSACYNFLTNHIVPISGSCSLLNYKTLHFSLSMSRFRTTVIAFSHTDKYIYTTRYDRSIHQFVPYLALERLPDTPDPTYKSIRIYIHNSPVIVFGIAFIRIYFDNIGRVIGFETKLTTSMYDIPFNQGSDEDILYKSSNYT